MKSERFIASDNFLSDYWFQTLQHELMSSTFPWYLLTDVTFEGHSKQPEQNFGFSHKFFTLESGPSNFYGLVSPLVDKIEQKFDTKIDQLMRIRGGLYTNVGNPVIHAPHVDFHYQHQVVLFYVYGDGPTYIYEDYVDCDSGQPPNISSDDHANMLKSSTSIEPKDNCAILFDGRTFHSSSSPLTKNVRIVISINFR